MREIDVRKALLAKLYSRFLDDSSTRIVEEMGIWSGSVRIDVAVINGQLHGYELKSAQDTLDRLPYQAELYSQVFDRVTLVIADKHLPSAQCMIPSWWGIMRAFVGRDGAIRLRRVRGAKRNPDLIALQLARLLWRSELLQALEEHSIARGYRRAALEQMAERLACRLPLRTLRLEVRQALKSRQGWLGQPRCHE
jgi:hypothetical protein